VPAVLVDTGPLVAVLDRSDPDHAKCVETLQSIDERLITVWPVITEAMYLLRSFQTAQDALLEMVESNVVEVLTFETGDISRVRELIRKYRDLPMDFADAALVRVAEREKINRIFTLDRRDFQIYRPSRLGRFAILPSS
jgi:predicted nucleic acid-binding protein